MGEPAGAERDVLAGLAFGKFPPITGGFGGGVPIGYVAAGSAS